MGAMEIPPGRDLAGTRDLRGLGPDHTQLPRDVATPTTAPAADWIPAGTEGFDVPRDHIQPPDQPHDRPASDKFHQHGAPEYRDQSHIDRSDPSLNWKPLQDNLNIGKPEHNAQPVREAESSGGNQSREPVDKGELSRRLSDDRSQTPAKELIDKVRDRVAGDPDKFTLSYSDRELSALVEQGRQLGLSDRSIADLIQTGSRIAKPVTADTLARHMDNWANVVSERGYPYRFDSAEHFNAFARDFHEALHRAGLGDLDPYIQGSALRKPEAKDVDFALVIDRDRFYELLADRFDGRAAIRAADATPTVPLKLKDLTRSEIWDLAQQIDANKNAYNSQARTFSNAVLKGVVRSTSDISKPLKAAGKEIQSKYPELNIEDISLIVPDSAFDSSPELPVVETTDKDRAQELADRLNGARERESQRAIEDLYRFQGELPNDKPAPEVAENLDGNQRASAPPRDLITQRGQELARDFAAQREQALESLAPYWRESVELVVELANYRLPDIEATIERAQAKEALDRAWSALERGGPLSGVSRDLVLARDHLTTGQRLELESRLDVLRDFDLGNSAKIAEHLLEISIHEQNHSVTAELEVADRHLLETATQKVLEFREGHLEERARFVQHELNRAHELERILAEGKAPELADVLQNYDAVERVIRHEREMEARAIQKLGLDPKHERIVAHGLELDRASTLGKASDAFRNEFVRQATEKVMEAREPEERATAQFVELIRERARELEQAAALGKEPDPAQVREMYNQIHRAVEHERAVDSRALETLGLNRVQTDITTRILEAERARTYENVLDVFGRELVRQDHNETVGQAKSLELAADKMRTLDPKVYQLVRNHDPIGRSAEKGVLIYRQPGREPIEVPYDSLARRYAEAAKGIDRGFPSEIIVQRFLWEVSQGHDARESVRERPEEAPHRTRARESEARERGLERER
ncbi:hypothetical protein ACIBG0_28950 [Nocardia sp. NPDC050630]|uniref:hypothetical protein n=1 Tax=Nocardia sp. NPDC050630 TaxID=3364321 RepID=UPI0037BA3DB2